MLIFINISKITSARDKRIQLVVESKTICFITRQVAGSSGQKDTLYYEVVNISCDVRKSPKYTFKICFPMIMLFRFSCEEGNLLDAIDCYHRKCQ